MLIHYGMSLLYFLSGYVLILFFLQMFSMDACWLRTSDGQRLVFQTPTLQCISLVMFVPILPAGFTLVASFTSVPETSDKLWLWGFGAMCYGMTSLIVWLAGPTRLEIDLRQHTYRHTRLWLSFVPASRRCGSLDEMSGVCSTLQGSILLVFKTRRFLSYGYLLGHFSPPQRASIKAEQIAGTLSLPTVDVPWSR
jgi:hypothetical protein